MADIHPQVDSGLGYPVDLGVKDLVLALNALPGVVTTCSCQSSANHHWPWVEFTATPGGLSLLIYKVGVECLVLNCMWSSQDQVWHGSLQAPAAFYDAVVEALRRRG